MALKIIAGDILNVDAEAIVIPANSEVCTGRLLDKVVYEKAGYDDMLKARKEIGKIAVGKAEITPAFALNAKYVIHAVTPSWAGGYSGEPMLLTDCYCNSLMSAVKANVKSVAFPLLGSGSNRMPVPKAKTIAEDTINGWLRSHKSQLQVYLVILPEDMELLEGSSSSLDCVNRLSNLEQQRENDFQKYLDRYPSKCKADFLNERMRDYIRKGVEKNSDFCKVTSYSEGSMSRLVNGETQNPSRNIAISLVIYMKLSKEERMDFMECAGKVYPSEKRDFIIEELLENGIKDFMEINERLYAQNPKWLLSNTKDGVVKTKEKEM